MKRTLFKISMFSLSLSVIFYFIFYFAPTIETPESSKKLTASPLIAYSSKFFSTNEDQNNEPAHLKTIADLRDALVSEKFNFMEINLSEMNVKLHQEGNLLKEVPILTKGDPQIWGGTAAGLYEVLQKTRVAFSIVSDVYMPYAIQFYGKYYLHGEAYYPNGEKLVSDVSGGCIRLKDKDAKEIYSLTEKGLPVLVIDKENDQYQYATTTASFPETTAKSYLAADLDSGYVFAEKNSTEVSPIASLTKLMTATILAENINLRRSIIIKDSMLEAYGTTEKLVVGESFRVVELFYPLLIESSNDAAEALSYFLGKAKTIRLMNEKADSILMKDTFFADPSGFDPENVSTARDLFQLARYVLNNRPLLLEITKGKSVSSFGEVKFDIKELWNKNVFIADPSFIGGKTGYIKASKHTSLFIFKLKTKEGEIRNIAIILLGSSNDKTDTQIIYKWLMDNYALLPAE